MQRDEVERVLTGVEEAGVRYWLSGGWGVAALVGRQTREHRDLDLLVDADHVTPCLKALGEGGYRARPTGCRCGSSTSRRDAAGSTCTP